ncbi:MAG: SDR family oxidoreductase [candidate division Zixibacteria bacterium]|nr:SDR family oxidoreductase [candidate division Zixibacteria bacterium]MBU1469066.1 SDR family oxidoreductase [candidate division Zixibacteria bacterium]MBU2624642.1 SDR family oxidoreductase [candidate division Zixibacteria bacterium]
MHYLITGGAGFVGSNIATRLVSMGETVTVLDNFSSGKISNLEAVRKDIRLIEGDIRDFETVAKAMKNVDYVLHQAAIASVELSVKDPVGSTEVNIGGTLNVLEASKRAGIERLVFASSAAVYGDLPDLPKSECSLLKVLSPYAAAKLAGEHYCRIYSELFGLETVCLRYFNIFGPYQDPNSDYSAVIPKFIECLLSGNQLRIFGDGEQSRDFLYIDNVVSANLLATKSNDAVGESINIAAGKRFNLLELLDILKDITAVDAEPLFEAEKPGDIKHSVADISKAKKLLRFDVDVDFREGLARTVEHFRTKTPARTRAN